MTYSLARIRLGLHKLPNRVASTDSADVGLHLNEMTGRLATLRQLHMSLFVRCLLCERSVRYPTGDSILLDVSLPSRFDVFETTAAVAFLAFVVLTILYAFQWAVTVRLQPAYTATCSPSYSLPRNRSIIISLTRSGMMPLWYSSERMVCFF